MRYFDLIIDWSEVWALLIPFITILVIRKGFNKMQPLVIYTIVALILNSFSTVSYFFHAQMHGFMRNNNIFYNLHSIARVVFFGWFIYNVAPAKHQKFYLLLLSAYACFIVVHFAFNSSILFFDTTTFAAESIVLLVIAISYCLTMMLDDQQINWVQQPSFLVIGGILFYEVVTFFIFLFILPMAKSNPSFGLLCLKIYKFVFVFLCVMIAIALIKNTRKRVLVAGTG